MVLDWLERRWPALRALFEVHPLPCRTRRVARHALHLPWVQDPMQRWSPRGYAEAVRLARRCDEHRVPIINRVDRLLNASKSTGARLIGTAGLRTPRMRPIADVEEFRATMLGLDLPLLVREDWGHGGEILRAETRDEVRRLPLERFERPIAVEFIETRDGHDGLYRKYRYVAAGAEEIPLHLHVCRGWVARGDVCVFEESVRDEEVRYLSRPDPHAPRLQAAREALGLDFVAFDYSLDPGGEIVVWEANPLPTIHFPRTGRRAYRTPALERLLAAMMKLYLQKAGLPVPGEVEAMLTGSGPS